MFFYWSCSVPYNSFKERNGTQIVPPKGTERNKSCSSLFLQGFLLFLLIWRNRTLFLHKRNGTEQKIYKIRLFFIFCSSCSSCSVPPGIFLEEHCSVPFRSLKQYCITNYYNDTVLTIMAWINVLNSLCDIFDFFFYIYLLDKFWEEEKVFSIFTSINNRFKN